MLQDGTFVGIDLEKMHIKFRNWILLLHFYDWPSRVNPANFISGCVTNELLRLPLSWVKRYFENIGLVHGLYLHMIVMYGIVFGVNFLQ